MTARKQAQLATKARAVPKPKPKPKPKPAPKLEDPADSSPLLLTVEQSAGKLGICRDFMYRLLAGPHPKVRSVKIGRSRRVPVSELEAYIVRRLSSSEAEVA